METEALKRRQLRPSVCFSAVEKCHVSRSRGHLQLKTDILQTHFTHSTADGWLWHFQRWHANDSSSVLPAAPSGAAVEIPVIPRFDYVFCAVHRDTTFPYVRVHHLAF